MQPQGIDTSAIREAIMRRAQGGGGTPAVQQMSQPQGQLPTGGMSSPVQQAPPVQPTATNVTPGNAGAPVSAEGNVVGKLKQGASFDDATKQVAKQLLSKLIGVL